MLLLNKGAPRESLRIAIARAFFSSMYSECDAGALERLASDYLGDPSAGRRYSLLLKRSVLENAGHRFWAEPMPKEPFSGTPLSREGLLATAAEVLLNDEVPPHVLFYRPFFEDILKASPDVRLMHGALGALIQEASARDGGAGRGILARESGAEC